MIDVMKTYPRLFTTRLRIDLALMKSLGNRRELERSGWKRTVAVALLVMTPLFGNKQKKGQGGRKSEESPLLRLFYDERESLGPSFFLSISN